MGHSRAEKEETHRRIVGIAAQRFREAGLDGVGVADLMKEAGLTVGGFYKHFRSRDDLVLEAIAAALAGWQDRVEAGEASGTPLTLEGLLEEYLSAAHRDSPGTGCAVATLAGDVSRSSEQARALYTEQVIRNIALVGKLLGGEDPAAARARAILVLSALAGALSLSRAVSDEALSLEILTSVRALLSAG